MARFSLSVYGDDAFKAKFERVKAYYVAKNEGIPLSDSNVGVLVIEDSFQKIEGKETNTNRITTIIERLEQLEVVVVDLVQAMREVTNAVSQLDSRYGQLERCFAQVVDSVLVPGPSEIRKEDS